MLNLDNFANIKTVHIIKDGQSIFEYIRENEKETSLFSVGCIFKSFLSVLVGIALYEGKIGSIDDGVIDYISHEKITDINWYKLKIKHALSKTTGIVWPRPQELFPANNCVFIGRSIWSRNYRIVSYKNSFVLCQ